MTPSNQGSPGGRPLRRVWRRGRLHDLLGVRHPVVQGPFGGGVSSVRLAAAVADAGGPGSFGAHHLAPDRILALVAELRTVTAGPFAVNLWVPQPGEQQSSARLSRAELERQVARIRPYLRELGLPDPAYAEIAAPTGPDFDDQVEAVLAAGPPVFSFVMGLPARSAIDEARRRGIVTIGTATTVAEAVALAENGVDAVVASGADAGGHRGTFLRPVEESLVGTFSLVPQVADAVSIPVIAAGGIADARGVLAALTLGADGVQIGTGFLVTQESAADPVHKGALTDPAAGTTVLTRAFTGRLARGIPNRFSRELSAFEPDLPGYPLQHRLTLPIRRAASRLGRPDYVHLWAGQAAPLARAAPAGDYLHHLVSDTENLLRDRD